VILLLIALAFMQSDVQHGAIAGVVMKSSSILEQTLPNARLELTEGPGTPLIARTDAAGRFVFPNLAAGRYRLAVTKDGFIRKQYGPIVLQNRRQIRLGTGRGRRAARRCERLGIAAIVRRSGQPKLNNCRFGPDR
jgi:hypothetical protein